MCPVARLVKTFRLMPVTRSSPVFALRMRYVNSIFARVMAFAVVSMSTLSSKRAGLTYFALTAVIG